MDRLSVAKALDECAGDVNAALAALSLNCQYGSARTPNVANDAAESESNEASKEDLGAFDMPMSRRRAALADRPPAPLPPGVEEAQNKAALTGIDDLDPDGDEVTPPYGGIAHSPQKSSFTQEHMEQQGYPNQAQFYQQQQQQQHFQAQLVCFCFCFYVCWFVSVYVFMRVVGVVIVEVFY